MWGIRTHSSRLIIIGMHSPRVQTHNTQIVAGRSPLHKTIVFR